VSPLAVSLYVSRPLRAAIALLVLLALGGATYQGVTTSLERRRYPRPGRLIDVGGHQLQLHCTGRGGPIVVLEAPAAGLSKSWARVQDALTPLRRVCSYDRAGLGWSERSDDEFDPARVSQELQALLASGGEKPPYVVAGAGLGAAFARTFAVRFPSTVASVVLLDLPTSDHTSLDRNSLGRIPSAMPWLARFGILRLTGTSRRPGMEPAVRAFMYRPDHLTRAIREMARWDDAVQLADDEALARSGVRVLVADLPAPLGDDRGADAAIATIRRALGAAR
jgi:pimeloyl-ACP methyl ester carboxylesterase